MFLSYVNQSTLMKFMMYTKITHLHPKVSRQKKTNLETIGITCYKVKNLANLHPDLSRFYITKRITSSTTAI